MSVSTSVAGSQARFGLRLGAVVASLVAGMIHVAVIPEHAEEYWPFGLFFALVAAFQIAWPVPALLAPSRQAFATGVLVNGLLIAAWTASRTIGLPLGPGAWSPEAIGSLDVTATLAELVIVIGSLRAIRGLRRTATTR